MGKVIERAALYLRSSKDRSDVSIDAQRRQLQEMASERGFAIVAEFADVVESGKDENRQGFQDLIAAVRQKCRGWETLLLLDTSRLSRRRHISILFEEVEAKKHGVRVVYKSLPESDPITEMLLRSILQAMDEWHSLTSKAKGLAGMAENVRQGWRAGGRAPMGYQLVHTATGAIREGAPVMKSRLAIDDDQAPRMRRYLELRAAGVKRAAARSAAGVASSPSTLVDVEWNALTYAGHTVWNMRVETGNGLKRRPRAEWTVQRGTHAALISDDQAETLLKRLEAFDRGNHAHGDYLLTGLLKNPAGVNWHGSAARGLPYYRVGKGGAVSAKVVERAVVRQVAADLESSEFIAGMNAALKARFDERRRDDALPALRKEMADLERRIARLTEMLSDTTTPEPLLRQMEKHEARRLEIVPEILDREEAARDAGKVTSMTNAQVARLMRTLREEMDTLDRERLREFLAGLVDQVVLDAAAATLVITYRLSAATRVRLASPGSSESNPSFQWHPFPLRRAA